MKAPIGSFDELVGVLETDLGFCTCAYTDALPLLRDLLRLIVERTDGVSDSGRFQSANEGIRALLEANGSTAMRSWFVYALDRADLIMHGFNLYDMWIMDKGRWVLDGLERYPEPPGTEDAA